MADHFKLYDPNSHENPSLFWVVDFPLFEQDEETGECFPSHHPFTGWMPEDDHLLETEPWNVRSTSYDLVMNGSELISGSIRIHDPVQQAKVFKMLKISDEEAELRFGFLLEALRYGAPPMGGLAIGLDRTIMCLTGGFDPRCHRLPEDQSGPVADGWLPVAGQSAALDGFAHSASFPGILSAACNVL